MANNSVKTNAVLNIIKQCSNILFPLITYQYVTRVLGTAPLGRYGFADSIIQYAIILATLGVNAYAIREGARIRNDRERIKVFSGELFGINLCSLAISGILLLIATVFVDRIRSEAVIIAILSINMIAIVLGREWINSIYEDYLYLTLRYIFFQIIALVLMIVFVKTPEDLYIYVAIVVIGNAGAQLVNIFHTSKYVPIRIVFNRSSVSHLKPIFLMFSIAVASIIYINSDVTVLGFFKSEDEVGTYYMVGKIYTIIKTLMNAIITVSIPRISFYLGQNMNAEYNDLLNSLRKHLLLILIPSIVGLFLLSDNVLYAIGGDKLIGGTTPLRMLCVAMLFAVFGCFYAQSILIPNRNEKRFFSATMISAAVNLSLNLVLVPWMGMFGTAITTAISEIVVLLICRNGAKKYHQCFDNSGLTDILIGVVGVAIVCITIKLLYMNPIIELLVSVLLSVFIYCVVLILRKNPIAHSFMDNLSNAIKRKA